MKAYPYIYAWGKLLQSGTDYIKMQQARAREEGAPDDAIFWDSANRKWACLSNISPNNRNINWLKATANAYLKSLAQKSRDTSVVIPFTEEELCVLLKHLPKDTADPLVNKLQKVYKLWF